MTRFLVQTAAENRLHDWVALFNKLSISTNDVSISQMSAAQLNRFVKRNSIDLASFYIAYRGTLPLAICYAKEVGDVFWVTDFEVDKNGEGAAMTLVDSLINRARDSNCQRINHITNTVSGIETDLLTSFLFDFHHVHADMIYNSTKEPSFNKMDDINISELEYSHEMILPIHPISSIREIFLSQSMRWVALYSVQSRFDTDLSLVCYRSKTNQRQAWFIISDPLNWYRMGILEQIIQAGITYGFKQGIRRFFLQCDASHQFMKILKEIGYKKESSNYILSLNLEY